MSDSSAFDFGKFIPGFDFLQNLAASGKGAAGPVGGLHNWVAPTVSVDELDKRIQELKAVLFWLEQNGTALKATIQALEVQKMTLATLQGMNLSMAEVARAFTLPTQGTPAAAPSPAATPEHWPFAAAPAPQPAAAPTPAAEPEPQPEPTPKPEPPAAAAPKAAPARKRPPPAAAPAPAAAGLADPMQWWGALTQQFQQIAANAMRDAAPPATTAPGASDSIAAGEEGTGATAQEDSQKKPATKRPAKKAAKKASAPAARKAPAKKAAAKKTAARKKPAAKPAPAKPAAAGWPLPPPFKFGR
ncbi:MAG: hypothetical protein KA148_10895 [Ottowia sp.]|nr:hypothetical protein [Ottowia sp.]